MENHVPSTEQPSVDRAKSRMGGVMLEVINEHEPALAGPSACRPGRPESKG